MVADLLGWDGVSGDRARVVVAVHGLLRDRGRVLLFAGGDGGWSSPWDWPRVGESLSGCAARVLGESWGPGVVVEAGAVGFAHAVWSPGRVSAPGGVAGGRSLPDGVRRSVLSVFFWAPVWSGGPAGGFGSVGGGVVSLSGWVWVPLPLSAGGGLPVGLAEPTEAAIRGAVGLLPFSELDA